MVYLVNQKGKFNVPHGRYKNPLICDKENLLAVSKLLKNTNIINASFLKSEKKIIDDSSLVYLDSPYRPLNKKSNFNNYAGFQFTDEDQIKVGDYYYRNSNFKQFKQNRWRRY